MVRLFHEIDADRSGKLDIRELGVALDALAGPSARERALKKLAEKRERQERERQRKEEADRLAREARKAKAEAAGAPRVLGRIDAILKQKDLRIIDLFSASGFDTSGDGLLNAEEMQGALAKAGLKLNRIEARALIEYLDEDSSGEIDAKELENALRQWRRDFGEEHAHPKPHEMSKNHALMAAKAARARLHEQVLREPAGTTSTPSPSASATRLAADAGHVPREALRVPQDGHARRAVAREASASSASGARRRSRRAWWWRRDGCFYLALRVEQRWACRATIGGEFKLRLKPDNF